ncbi:9967_t:CDS:10 [Ambispora gerdemannii]|uniref:Glucosidase 2 subunit beta n=1 Tax=Ambispora gerdemannii TaxID=144530 RepID=A0A9N8Z226_9GLOM|nr:9967_t:CDS:10 [Ambispora gerdemannii]
MFENHRKERGKLLDIKNFLPLGIYFLFLLTCLLAAEAKVSNSNTTTNRLRGIAKSKIYLYEHTDSDWVCLDGSARIPYDAINDDFCDCKDGSDEPGTSACSNGRFYCENEGHIPAYVESFRVNDGKCEPECCDGSDEYGGKIQCPNNCEQVGFEHRKHLREIARTQAEGARIRREYIEYGKELRLERQADLERLQIELLAAKERVKERKEVLEQAEEEERRQIQLTTKPNVARKALKKCKERVESLHERIDKLHENIDTLLKIFKDLKNDHNQNYHDMAVKSAIAGYDDFLKEYENERDENLPDELDEEDSQDNNDQDNEAEEDIAPPIHSPLEKDEPSLLESIIDTAKITYNDIMESIGLDAFTLSTRTEQKSVVPGTSKGVLVARDSLNSAENEQREIENQINDINSKFSKDYGRSDEFAKLDGECFEHVTGEYTYSLCLFDSTTQKSNKDYSSTNLGNFERWIGAESQDDPAYYTKQIYEHGIKCWNGPERSLKVTFECSPENKIFAVSETEKCEYAMTMKTPAVCTDGDEDDNSQKNVVHEEL